MNNKPLVSIPVITYNSSSYIIDGLESVKAQNYKNIELVISDDRSTDNTVEICKEWIEKNKDFFKRAIIITSEKNTGVAGNLNRAIKECEGEWIKPLSGDDKFIPETIERYIKYINKNPDASIIFGKLIFYGSDPAFVEKTKNTYETKFYPKIQLDLHKQYIENLKYLFVPGPGLIYKKVLFDAVGGYDERYPFSEEHPFTTNVLTAGHRIYFLDEYVYRYQVREGSLSKTYRHGALIRPQKDSIRYFFDYRRKKMINNNLLFEAWNQTIKNKIVFAKDKNQKFRILFYGMLMLTSPIFYKNVVIYLRKNIFERN